jgi:hypothetical protein
MGGMKEATTKRARKSDATSSHVSRKMQATM